MAFTLAQLRERLEEMTDTQKDKHLSTDEKNRILAEAAAETWDHIIASGLSERYVKSASFSTTGGTSEYDLTSSAIIPDEDFYKVHQVYINEGNNEFRPLPRIEPADIQNFRPPTGSVTVKLYYIKAPPTFITGAIFDDTATLDVPAGLEAHTLNTAAMAVKKKKEDDYRPFESRKAEIEQRIKFMGSTDWSQPARVVRRRHRMRDGYWYPYNAQITAYILRGKKIELYYAYPFVP